MSVEEQMQARRRMMSATAAVAIVCGTSYFAMLVGILRSVMVMRMLGPTFQGVRRLVDLFTKYLFNIHFGVLHGCSKQLPLHLGEHDAEKVRATQEVGISWILGLTLVGSLAMVAVGLANPTGSRTTAIAIVVGGGWLLAQQAITVYRTMLRSWGEFGLLGLSSAVDTLAGFVFTLLGAWKYGVVGAMVGTLLGWCLTLLVLGRTPLLRIRPRFDLRTGLELARIGIPIAIYIFADTLLRTVDGTLVGIVYKPTQLGLYSLAMQVAGYLYAIPESAGFVIWPRIIEAYGRYSGDTTAMRRQVVVPTIAAGHLTPILAGACYIVLPPVVMRVLPQFTEATAAAQVLAMASVFLALPMATNSLLIAHRQDWQAIAVKLIGAGVTALGSWWVISHHGPLTHVAIAAGVGYATAALLSLALVLPHYTNGAFDTLKVAAGVILPMLWSVGALYVSHELGGFVAVPSPASMGWALTRLVIFCLLMVPILIDADRQTGLLAEVQQVFRRTTQAEEESSHD